MQQVYFTPVYLLSIEGDCPHYQPDTTARFAIGVTHLYDKLTHTQEKKIRHALIRRFRRSPYYRIYRKEKLLKPVDIEFIRQLFIREGIAEEPLFDEYVNLPDWQE